MFHPVSLDRPFMIRLAHAAIFLLLSGAAFAETEPPPHRVMKLDLETALQKALASNFTIQVDRFDPQIAREDVRKELGAFDPVFDIKAEHDDERHRELVIEGKSVQTRNSDRLDLLSSGITGITSWGTKYDASIGTRGHAGTPVLFEQQFETKASLQLTQPLLRGAGTAVNLAQVRIARNAVKVSEWQLRKNIIDIMTKTSFVYNELQFS
ncbi:MAG TPA: TolC family protein, partial [Chthoniobacteraceae bacterium]|nr:TolC family protein [Chthoniobacteraceae bacterium]